MNKYIITHEKIKMQNREEQDFIVAIHLQKEELSRGRWFRKDNLPILPEKLSIARKLIDAWLEEK